MTDWTDVAAVKDLPPGTHTTVTVEDVTIAVFNLAGQFYAIEDICTHDGGSLTGGEMDGDEIVCPRHGARFSIKTGAVLAPPAYEGVATFPVRVQDGRVQVRDDRWD